MKYLFTASAFFLWLMSQGQVQLSAGQWKAVEGIFKNWQNSDMNIRFEVRGDTLVARPLWAEFNPILLKPVSPLEFHSIETGERSNFKVVFNRDSTGSVNEVMVNGNDQWLRNNHYQPLVREEIAHTPEQIRPFEGLYQFEGQDVRYLQLFERDNRLIVKQLWDGGELAFLMQSDLSFYFLGNKVLTIDFSKDDAGQVTRMVFFRRDHWKKTNKVTLTPAAIRQYEGKYRSRDDPDNQLQLIARDSNLVVKQVWDGKEIALTPISDLFFYNDVQSYPLQVKRSPDGKVKSILILSSQEFDKVPE